MLVHVSNCHNDQPETKHICKQWQGTANLAACSSIRCCRLENLTAQSNSQMVNLHCESKKLDPFSFEHNFCKYNPILIIRSLLQTEIIYPHIHNWISHLTCSLLLHYLEKNATAYTSSRKLLNKSAMHAVISLLLQSRKFWCYLLLFRCW